MSGLTQLEFLCEYGDHNAVERLLDEGADPSVNNNLCLRIACSQGYDLIVDLLLSLDLSRGVDASVNDNFCLRKSSYLSHYSIVYKLLLLDESRGVDPLVEDYRIIIEATIRGNFYFVIWVLQDTRITSEYDKIKEKAVEMKNAYDYHQNIAESANLDILIRLMDQCYDLFTSRDPNTQRNMKIIEAALRDDINYALTHLSDPSFYNQNYHSLKEAVNNLVILLKFPKLQYLLDLLCTYEFFFTTDPIKNDYEVLVKLSRKREWDAVDFFLEKLTSEQLNDAAANVKQGRLKAKIISFKDWKKIDN